MKNHTIKELTKIFKVGEETIRLWYRKGKIKGTRIGRRILVRDEEVKRLMEERLVETPLKPSDSNFAPSYPRGEVLVIHPCKKCRHVIKTEKVSKDKVEETMKNGPKICEYCKEKLKEKY